VSRAQELPRQGTRGRGRVSRKNAELCEQASRLVENAELSQHRSPVIVDFFPGQTVIRVECVHTQSAKSTRPPGRRKTTPAAQAGTANHADGQAGWTPAEDCQRTGPEVGSRQAAAADSSASRQRRKLEILHYARTRANQSSAANRRFQG